METCASELNRPVLTRTTPTEETRLVCLRCGAQLCSRRVAVVCVRRHSHSLFFFFFGTIWHSTINKSRRCVTQTARWSYTSVSCHFMEQTHYTCNIMIFLRVLLLICRVTVPIIEACHCKSIESGPKSGNY